MAKSLFDVLSDSDVDELLAKLEAQRKLKILQEEGGDTGDVSEEEAAAAEKAALAAEAKAKAEADAAAKAEEEAKAAALAAVQQAPSKSVTGDNIFTPTTVKAVQTATETGKGGDSADITTVGKIPVVTDPALIGADGGAFSGGLGKPSTNLADVLRQDITYASGYRPGQGIFVNPEEAARLGVDRGNIFLSNPNWLNAPSLTGAVPGISPGGPAVGGAGGGPVSNVQLGDQTITISFDDIVQKEIQRELDAMRSEGVFSSDPEFGTRLEVAANRGLDIYNQDVSRAKELGKYIDLGPQKGATTPGQGGIPLILPIPGLDPATAAAITAAGLIFSGGKIARLNPQNPAGSVAGAVQGVGQTGQNVVDVVTGKTTIGEIWDPGSTGAASGTTGTGTGTGATSTAGGQQTTGTGAIGAVGGIFGGGMSGGTTGTSGAGQQTTTGGTVGVTPGALGGDTGQAPSTTTTTAGTTKPAGSQQVPSTGGPYIYDTAEKTQNVLGTIMAPSQAIQQQAAQEKAAADANAWITGIVSGAAAKRDELSSQQTTGVTATTTSTTTSTSTDVKPDASGYVVTNTPSGVRIQSPIATVVDTTTQSPRQIDLAGDVTSKPPAVTPTPSPTVPTSTTTTTTGTAATPIIINAPTTGYTLPQAGTPAQRNLYTEAGTTLASLAAPMGRFQIGVDAQGNPIMGGPAAGTQAPTLSEAISQGYGGLARGMTQSDIANLLQSIGAQTGISLQPGQAGGYQSALTTAANEQTAAANRALRAGNIADAEAYSARAQALRQQMNPELFGAGGALPQYTQAAQGQVSRDLAALQQAGQLTPEEVRNAQQAAREAYAARGQVFSQGAAAQEVLNRQQMIQQRQQLARQNLAQSMGQLGQGVAYQTANIFDPMAATLGAQYGMQSQNVGMNQALYNQAMGLTSGAGGYGFAQQMINPFSGYAQDVYGSNINAQNAAQIAASNRQAALEAAKMGQTGTYAQAAGNLIASGGLGQIQSGITGGIQGLLSLLGGKWPTS